MSFILRAIKELISSVFFWIFTIVDVLAIVLDFYDNELEPTLYLIIFVFAILFGSIHRLSEMIKIIDNSLPLVISNDNLSLGGQGYTIDGMSIRNIGNSMAVITNISSDRNGKIRIIDNHYMERFFLDPNSATQNIMLNEWKIVQGLQIENKNKKLPTTSIMNDWNEPFYVYIWYETVSGKNKFCTRIKFQSGERFIRNLGSEQIKVK